MGESSANDHWTTNQRKKRRVKTLLSAAKGKCTSSSNANRPIPGKPEIKPMAQKGDRENVPVYQEKKRGGTSAEPFERN